MKSNSPKEMKKKIIEKTKQIFNEMIAFFPYDCVYSVHKMKERENGSGGHFSILYEPTTRKVDFYIYEKVYEEVSDLSKKQILWLKYTIAHEIGHLFIWELATMMDEKYNHDFVEKAASDIAFLLVDLHKLKYN